MRERVSAVSPTPRTSCSGRGEPKIKFWMRRKSPFSIQRSVRNMVLSLAVASARGVVVLGFVGDQGAKPLRKLEGSSMRSVQYLTALKTLKPPAPRRLRPKSHARYRPSKKIPPEYFGVPLPTE